MQPVLDSVGNQIGVLDSEGHLIEDNPDDVEDDYLSITSDGRVIDLRDEARDNALQKRLLFARALVEEDPARAANVINAWLRSNQLSGEKADISAS